MPTEILGANLGHQRIAGASKGVALYYNSGVHAVSPGYRTY
jgi:hypothetical protein